MNDVYNTWAFVGGFLKSLIDRVHNNNIEKNCGNFAYKIGTVEKLLQFFFDLCIHTWAFIFRSTVLLGAAPGFSRAEFASKHLK